MNIEANIATAASIKDVEEIRSFINEACDNRIKVITLCNRANELSDRSFGFIKEAFENISPSLFESTAGRKLINKYAATIRKSKQLSSMQALYENVRTAQKTTDLDFFVNSLASTEWDVNKNRLTEDTKELGKILGEAYIVLEGKCEDILPKEDYSFSLAMEFIAENKRSKKNIAEYSNAVKIIRENVEKNGLDTSSFKKGDIDSMADELVREFNEKYTGKLNEAEMNLIKELAESTDHEAVFNKYKEQCAAKIDEAKKNFKKEGNEESIKKLDNISEQIAKKAYTPDTLSSDICNFIEMTSIFE